MLFSAIILPRVVNPGSTTENVTQPNSGHVFGVNEFIFTLVTRKTNFLLQADISSYLFSQIKLVTIDNVLPYYAWCNWPLDPLSLRQHQLEYQHQSTSSPWIQHQTERPWRSFLIPERGSGSWICSGPAWPGRASSLDSVLCTLLKCCNEVDLRLNCTNLMQRY